MICLFLTLANFSGASRVYAANEDVPGGIIITPAMNLLTAIADAIMDVMHDALKGQDAAIIRISGETNWSAWWKRTGGIVLGIFIVALGIAALSWIAAIAAPAIAVIVGSTFTVTQFIASAIVPGLVVGIMIGVRIRVRLDEKRYLSSCFYSECRRDFR